jgi:sugar (pentulose or hexulose) kinase
LSYIAEYPCRAAVRIVETVDPRAEAVKSYAEGHRKYQALYPALRGLWGE